MITKVYNLIITFDETQAKLMSKVFPEIVKLMIDYEEIEKVEIGPSESWSLDKIKERKDY